MIVPVEDGNVTRRGIVLFVALGIAWGIPYALIRVAVDELSPVMVVFARTALAGLLLLPVALARHEVLPVLRRWRPMLAYTVAEIILPWYFLNSAERTLPSSTAGLLIAAVPLAGVAVAWAIGRPARLSLGNWSGILVGMCGVAALVGLDVAGSDLLAVAGLAITVVGYATGPAIIARWMPDLPGVGIVVVSLLATSVVYAPLVAGSGAWPSHLPSAGVVGAVVTLAVVCSAAAFLLMIALVAEIGPVRATAITYLNPAVAIAVGALWLHERISVWTVLGFALVLAGSYLVTRRRPGAPTTVTTEPLEAAEPASAGRR